LTVSEGVQFPNRDLIIFLTFCVIFATLVLQGLTLPALIKWFKLSDDNALEKEHDHEARLKIAYSVIEHIEANYSLSLTSAVLDQIKTKYEIRINRLRKDLNESKLDEEQIKEFLKIQHDLIKRERAEIRKMKRERRISEEVLRRIEYELDLEESRLMIDLETA